MFSNGLAGKLPVFWTKEETFQKEDSNEGKRY
jgi:hypothetical protein